MNDFGRRLEREVPVLRRYARTLVRGWVEMEADDLVQSCLLRALAKQHLWQKGSDLRAWLLTILHNLHINDVRRLARERAWITGGISGFVALPPFDPGTRLLLRDLDRAFAKLPGRHRRVIFLVGFDGMCYDEAAAALAVPVGTVRSRLARARNRLRSLLDMEDDKQSLPGSGRPSRQRPQIWQNRRAPGIC